MITGAYANGLDQSPANHVPLTPSAFGPGRSCSP